MFTFGKSKPLEATSVQIKILIFPELKAETEASLSYDISKKVIFTLAAIFPVNTENLVAKSVRFKYPTKDSTD